MRRVFLSLLLVLTACRDVAPPPKAGALTAGQAALVEKCKRAYADRGLPFAAARIKTTCLKAELRLNAGSKERRLAAAMKDEGDAILRGQLGKADADLAQDRVNELLGD